MQVHQNISEIGGEITLVKTMLGDVLAKLNPGGGTLNVEVIDTLVGSFFGKP